MISLSWPGFADRLLSRCRDRSRVKWSNADSQRRHSRSAPAKPAVLTGRGRPGAPHPRPRLPALQLGPTQETRAALQLAADRGGARHQAVALQRALPRCRFKLPRRFTT